MVDKQIMIFQAYLDIFLMLMAHKQYLPNYAKILIKQDLLYQDNYQ